MLITLVSAFKNISRHMATPVRKFSFSRGPRTKMPAGYYTQDNNAIQQCTPLYVALHQIPGHLQWQNGFSTC